MITNKNIDAGKPFDWGRATEDYAKYRDIYPEEFYRKIVELGLCLKGQTVLDLGTGTGVIPRNMYHYGAKFTGADISENQILKAKELSEAQGMDIEYIIASAEEVDFPDNSFDVITACQCFMYFDKSIVLPKIHRMLKKDGEFCILFMAWLPEESEVAKGSEDLVLKYNPSWSGAGMKRYELSEPDWAEELFRVNHMLTYAIEVPFTKESWHGRMIACRGIGASSLSDEEIRSFEKEHLEYLDNFPETFDIMHFISLLSLKKK